MEKTPKNSKPDRQKLVVSERALLVPLAKSNKLMALRDKNQPVSQASNPRLPAKENFPDLKPAAAKELQAARAAIDDKIKEIMAGFPEAKKNSLFRFRFGSVEAIKTMPIMTAFKILGVNGGVVNMGLIADRDYYGNDTRQVNGAI